MHGERIRLHGIDEPESSQTCIVGLEVWLCSPTASDIICTLYEVSGGR